jgi:tRNA nucleotidyltransferase/poly(A) polymerase
MENDVIDNIILAKADRLSARGKEITDEIVRKNLEGLDKLLDFYLSKRQTIKPLPKLLDGNEIMEILNIPPSPILGEILKQLNEAQLNGDIIQKVDAIEYIKRLPH